MSSDVGRRTASNSALLYRNGGAHVHAIACEPEKIRNLWRSDEAATGICEPAFVHVA